MMIAYVAAGGAFGAVARYGMMVWLGRLMGHGFPYGTLSVNVIGGFLMGVLVGLGAHYFTISQEFKLFFMVGVLGGFTTFSTFSLDVITLYERGEMMVALLYVLLSVVLSVLALWFGMWLVRLVAGS